MLRQLFRRLRARWRLWRGVCPECGGGDEYCPVCADCHTGSHWLFDAPPWVRVAVWRWRFEREEWKRC